ncbi:hypothetical protein [Formosimonas limnophila]|nr:hypothetical protein [Formosimonas limnophila]
MSTSQISTQEIEHMVRHWLNTPMHTYLGDDYGFDRSALLLKASDQIDADTVIAKLKRDVPVLDILPNGSINLYGSRDGLDKLTFILQIANIAIEI